MLECGTLCGVCLGLPRTRSGSPTDANKGFGAHHNYLATGLCLMTTVMKRQFRSHFFARKAPSPAAAADDPLARSDPDGNSGRCAQEDCRGRPM